MLSMSKLIRVKYKKEDEMIFISHLDLQRLLQRAFRRAKINLSYSEGFNPHPKMSYGNALALGVESQGEYVDIEIEDDITVEEFLKRINEELPDGIKFVKGQEIDDSDKELLEGIVLKLEDEGNKDAPWPWEGEPVEPVLAEQMVGSYTIVPKYIPFKEAQGVMQIMDHQFVKQGNQVFHLLENKLDTYEYSESGLEFVSSMELDDDFEYLSGDSSGMLYLSPGIGDVIGVKDGKKALQTTVDGDLNMHPSGEWGISFWVNSDTQKIANQGGNLTAEPWILTGLNNDEERKGLFSMIDDVQITNSHIMVAGSMAAEDEGTKIVVYDYDGNQLLKLGGEDISSPDKLGSITGMAETENGFVAADGNMREIQFWAKDGTHVGAISTEDIFGVSYPWLEDMQLLDDGSLLIMLTQERDDGSANELMFFRLTGF